MRISYLLVYVCVSFICYTYSMYIYMLNKYLSWKYMKDAINNFSILLRRRSKKILLTLIYIYFITWYIKIYNIYIYVYRSLERIGLHHTAYLLLYLKAQLWIGTIYIHISNRTIYSTFASIKFVQWKYRRNACIITPWIKT